MGQSVSFTGCGDELLDVAAYYCSFADMKLDLRGKKFVPFTPTGHHTGGPCVLHTEAMTDLFREVMANGEAWERLAKKP